MKIYNWFINNYWGPVVIGVIISMISSMEESIAGGFGILVFFAIFVIKKILK